MSDHPTTTARPEPVPERDDEAEAEHRMADEGGPAPDEAGSPAAPAPTPSER